MKRISDIPSRKNYVDLLAEDGLIVNPNDVYWQENHAYEFTEAEIDSLDDAAQDLHEICIEAVRHIIRTNRFEEFRIPSDWVEYVTRTFERNDPYLYGRFDFVFDGKSAPKMLEYNADTPTALLEASVLQWRWLQQQGFPDQFNFIHEQLIETWQKMRMDYGDQFPELLHFVSDHISGEDFITTEYLRDTCQQAGMATRSLNISDIGYSIQDTCFADENDRKIKAMFMLYPWEFMVREEYGKYVLEDHTGFIEPAWKMLLSNKAILPLLWEIAPGHDNLLEAHFDAKPFMDQGRSYVKKAIFGREGASVEIVDDTDAEVSDGDYGQEGFIYQEYQKMPCFDDKYPVCGVWVVGGKSCGMGIREDVTRITRDSSNFVPHYFTK